MRFLASLGMTEVKEVLAMTCSGAIHRTLSHKCDRYYCLRSLRELWEISWLKIFQIEIAKMIKKGGTMDFQQLVARFETPGFSPGVDGNEWRIQCRDVARRALENVNVRLPIEQPVKIVCHFRVLQSSQAPQGPDIDNILKLLIDSLGAAGLFSSEGVSGPLSEWNTDDSWVFAVEADKELVETDAKTIVEVWCSSASSYE